MNWQRTGAVTGVNACFFDVFHDAGNIAVLAIAEAVDIHFDGLCQIGIEQKRVFAQQRVDLAGLVVWIFRLDVFRHQLRNCVEQICLQATLVMDDLHGTTTKNIRRADNQREAQISNDQARLLNRIGNAVLWLVKAELDQQLLEAVTVFSKIDSVR